MCERETQKDRLEVTLKFHSFIYCNLMREEEKCNKKIMRVREICNDNS